MVYKSWNQVWKAVVLKRTLSKYFKGHFEVFQMLNDPLIIFLNSLFWSSNDLQEILIMNYLLELEMLVGLLSQTILDLYHLNKPKLWQHYDNKIMTLPLGWQRKTNLMPQSGQKSWLVSNFIFFFFYLFYFYFIWFSFALIFIYFFIHFLFLNTEFTFFWDKWV